MEHNTIIPKITLNYYRLLASLPLLKVNDVIEFKAPLTSEGTSKGIIENDIVVAKAFRDWLVAYRVRPVSNKYCQSAASHPLCLSSQEMNEIVSLVDVNLDAIRTVNPVNPPVSLPPAPSVSKADPGRTKSFDPCYMKARCNAR